MGISHEISTPYYPQANGKVDAINKFLKTMLQHMVGVHKSHLHFLIYASLWAYRTSVMTTTIFTPFKVVYGLEVILPIEYEIPSLKLAIKLLPTTFVEEECLLHLTDLDETQQDDVIANEAHKIRIKA